jgi:serine/threonine protein kinase
MGEAGHERLIGRTIAGKFVVEHLLGTGAMGAVYRARQVALEKTVAIKVLHGEHASDPTFAARFHREAKAASRLNHPNSMQVIDFGAEPDGLLYIAMEYLDGRSLHQVLREDWPLSAARIVDILMQTLAALAVAHDMGVVHRDLKPENVMVLRGTDDDGRPKDVVKVCDFGIAKITDPRAYRGSAEHESNPPVTTAGFLVGTPEYMSPEQGRGERLDPRSDLYSVGVILFELLTRRVPFQAENAIGIVLKHVTEEAPRPSELAPVHPRLEAICIRALRKSSSDRYQNAREMRADLRAAIQRGSRSVDALAATVGHSTVVEAPASPPTIHMPPAPAVYPTDDSQPKGTLVGATSTIPGLRKRGVLLVATAALSSGATIGVIALVMLRSDARRPVVHASSATASTPPAAILMPLPTAPATEAAQELPPLTNAAPHAGAHGKPPITKAVSSGPVVAQAVAAPVLPSAAPAPPQAMAPATVGGATPAAPAAPAAPEALDPGFDPERGYVEIGLVNAQGAREGAIRGALRGVGLARCYRTALRVRGARATGNATLNLSFDETGFGRSAIVTGADFLPGLARCLQGICTGIRIPRSHVDPGGGTAEVLLSFKAP